MSARPPLVGARAGRARRSPGPVEHAGAHPAGQQGEAESQVVPEAVLAERGGVHGQTPGHQQEQSGLRRADRAPAQPPQSHEAHEEAGAEHAERHRRRERARHEEQGTHLAHREARLVGAEAAQIAEDPRAEVGRQHREGQQAADAEHEHARGQRAARRPEPAQPATESDEGGDAGQPGHHRRQLDLEAPEPPVLEEKDDQQRDGERRERDPAHAVLRRAAQVIEHQLEHRPHAQHEDEQRAPTPGQQIGGQHRAGQQRDHELTARRRLAERGDHGQQRERGQQRLGHVVIGEADHGAGQELAGRDGQEARGQPSRPAIEQALAEQADDHDGEPAHDRRRQGPDDLDGPRRRCAEPDHPGQRRRPAGRTAAGPTPPARRRRGRDRRASGAGSCG